MPRHMQGPGIVKQNIEGRSAAPMSQFFQIHPENPQARLIRQAVDIVRAGGVIVYPTDSAYALGCQIGDKAALDRIRRIRRLDARHNFTLVCRDLSELATYARVDNTVYRLLKAHTPGAYTFILRATSEVPRRLMHPKRRTVGLRVPDNAIAQALLADLNEPLMSVTLIMPDDELPLIDPYEIRELLEHDVDLVIDGGYCGMEATTVVDLADDMPMVLRAGKGDPAPFEGA
jgi:tRNA threonylcarbamoyl adenosine modification protein (Sua5/YciO/YrdC/YwlC family)